METCSVKCLERGYSFENRDLRELLWGVSMDFFCTQWISVAVASKCNCHLGKILVLTRNFLISWNQPRFDKLYINCLTSHQSNGGGSLIMDIAFRSLRSSWSHIMSNPNPYCKQILVRSKYWFPPGFGGLDFSGQIYNPDRESKLNKDLLL